MWTEKNERMNRQADRGKTIKVGDKNTKSFLYYVKL
jgi:hypothetical protein